MDRRCTPGYGRSSCSHHLHGSAVNMADCVGAGAHRVASARTSAARADSSNDAVFASSTLAGSGTACAFATVARPGRRGCCLVQFLLVAQQEVAAGKTTCALGALERLLLGMRSLMAFQMLQACEGALASLTDMRPRLVGLGRRKGLCVDGDCRRCFLGRDWSILVSTQWNPDALEHTTIISVAHGACWSHGRGRRVGSHDGMNILIQTNLPAN